jgi:hypothetical protein
MTWCNLNLPEILCQWSNDDFIYPYVYIFSAFVFYNVYLKNKMQSCEVIWQYVFKQTNKKLKTTHNLKIRILTDFFPQLIFALNKWAFVFCNF